MPYTRSRSESVCEIRGLHGPDYGNRYFPEAVGRELGGNGPILLFNIIPGESVRRAQSQTRYEMAGMVQ